MATFALWSLPLATLICMWVAWSDLARMKIPNKAVLALLAVFAVVGLLTLPLEAYLWRYAHFAAVLAIGFLMTITGLVGAGDAKFAAAMAPFVAVIDGTFVAAIFAVTTIVAFILHRLARVTPLRKLAPNWESWERTRDFPMGLPLAVTLIVYLARTAFL
ncbi:prepilin peptidase CpaA [Litoreibacter ascidiaceicola]|uniref:Prepilin peptidase CpaA n=1 Tax=Litoreibacter ascidiaceicola TaxID=1486859 RepID=A0A1M4Y841_9RHOB|nr:prepilin peptidase [Litoreibacter ascidiaceicola]SHF01839.1 prepilin peptidase CpaA [Litoreibacter ascidiaceicola]